MSKQVPTVLIVEDHPVQRTLYKHLSEKLNFKACIVASGKDALDIRLAQDFHAIFMDWQMPEMTGLECAVKIRELELNAGVKPVPIIGITAHAIVGDREKCLDAGMNDYLAKPFTMDQLDRIIKQWCWGQIKNEE